MTQQPPVNSGQPTELNVMSVVGFALAVSCAGLGIGSLIVSIIGLMQINKEPGRYHGKGFAVAGIVLSILTIIGFIIYVAIIVFAVTQLPDGWSLDSDPSF